MREHRYLKNVTTLAYGPARCTGCGLCAEVCPHRVFEVENGKARVRNGNLCMECGACARNCPFAAISVRAEVGCAWAIMASELRGKKVVACG